MTERIFVPFTTFVTKVVSRCNLNCDYCYMYNLADRTWRDQPPVMSETVTQALGERISAYSERHGIPAVHVILHGGEPLMMGHRRLASWVSTLRGIMRGRVAPCFSIQSNGVLIDDRWIDLLYELNVRIGISVDGPQNFHDRHRRDHRGSGSYADVIAAIRRLRASEHGRAIFSNVLAVVNTNIPPNELFAFWQNIDVPGFDLSMPHANYAHPPPQGAMSYGDWLVEFFDLWFDQNRADRGVRYFENMIRCLFGYPVSTDNIGGRPVGVVVVETDGSIEPTDAFKCCEDGITKAGRNVLNHNFEDVQSLAMIQTLQGGASELCSTCRACEVRDVCGGGYMPHRYSRGEGFDNPSVYCADLEQIIRHIRRRIMEEIPPELFREFARMRQKIHA